MYYHPTKREENKLEVSNQQRSIERNSCAVNLRPILCYIHTLIRRGGFARDIAISEKAGEGEATSSRPPWLALPSPAESVAGDTCRAEGESAPQRRDFCVDSRGFWERHSTHRCMHFLLEPETKRPIEGASESSVAAASIKCIITRVTAAVQSSSRSNKIRSQSLVWFNQLIPSLPLDRCLVSWSGPS